MKHALKIGDVARIGIFVHWTFFLMLVGLFAFYLYQGATPAAALSGVGLVSAVFVCVVLHELGHALTARHFGIPTLDITIYPIGGIARLEGIPREPRQEFWIAIAGPAVNLVIAGVLFLFNLATGQPTGMLSVLQAATSIPGLLMWLNLSLVGFNMLPAFPMDGGRVLRAGLATQMDYVRATRIAAYVGQGMAVLFGLYGLWIVNPVLLFIAAFVFLGARQEAQQVGQE